MKLYFIRHTDTIEGNNNIILGHLGGELSKEGILKANNIGKFFKNGNFEIRKIITSDLKRSIDTGEIINKYLNKDLIKLPIIKERSAGENEGKNEKEVNWKEYEKKSIAYRKHTGGESFIDVKKRAKEFLNILDKKYDRGLFISHSVFILMLICVFKKLTIKEALKINIKDKLICVDFEKNNIVFEDIK